jgi:hypothetical protein
MYYNYINMLTIIITIAIIAIVISGWLFYRTYKLDQQILANSSLSDPLANKPLSVPASLTQPPPSPLPPADDDETPAPNQIKPAPAPV